MHIEKNIHLKHFTTYKIGGPADEFVIARTRQELKDAILYALDRGIPYFILGAGANILVSDQGFRGLVIRNKYDYLALEEWSATETKKLKWLRAGSGTLMQDAILLTRNHGLSGFEHFAGIPSTVGGALWQNLHFMNASRDGTSYISDVFHHAYVFNIKTGSETILYNNDFRFGYDTSILHAGNHVVLEAVFSLQKLSRLKIYSQIKSNLAWRQERHPSIELLPSCGSVFKKTMYQGETIAAAKLIDQAGLKGYCYRQAQISTIHPNFIVNQGGAMSRDILYIIRHVQKVVHEKFGVMLEPEIRFVGEFAES
ncbi:MAG: murB [Patescibacteria group bacterium]|nr:murB [Patescibacteria group bacterium]